MPNQLITNDVYLSHCSQDKQTAAHIRDTFEAANVCVWIDRTGVSPGTPNWQQAIKEAIQAAVCFVVILSPDAKNSEWLNNEIALALSLDKTIILLLTRGSAENSIPPSLSAYRYVDLREYESFDRNIQGVIDVIRQEQQSTAPVSSATKTTPDSPVQESLFKRLAGRFIDEAKEISFEDAAAPLLQSAEPDEESGWLADLDSDDDELSDWLTDDDDEESDWSMDDSGDMPDWSVDTPLAEPTDSLDWLSESKPSSPPPAPAPAPMRRISESTERRSERNEPPLEPEREEEFAAHDRSFEMPTGKKKKDTADPEPVESADAVQFSAYYVRETRPADWQPLHAYIFKAFASAEVSSDVQKQLGDRSDIRGITKPAKQAIAQGALVTATPHIPGFEFDPPSQSARFRKDWRRFDFEFQAVDAPLDEAANGRVTFTIEGVVVADVPLSVYVTMQLSTPAAPPTEEATADPYDAIFCSYSHDDMPIAEHIETFCRSLGIDYLRDKVTLKPGQIWSKELLNMIDRADIFQLLWSDTAKESRYVKQEWQYALALIAQQQKDENFIRPITWLDPMPKPPRALKHIHFGTELELAEFAEEDES